MSTSTLTDRTNRIDRSAALALSAGSLAGLVTMALHPTGHDVIENATLGLANIRSIAVHWLAIVAQPAVLAGALGLTLRLRTRRDLAVGAYVFFAVASIAVIVAAIASGLLGSEVVDGLDEVDAATRALMLRELRYTGEINEVFAAVYVVLSGIAILLWSSAIILGRELSRALGAFGVTLSLLLIAGVLSGHLQLGIHGFGAVVLGEGVWMTWAAAGLWGTGAADARGA